MNQHRGLSPDECVIENLEAENERLRSMMKAILSECNETPFGEWGVKVIRQIAKDALSMGKTDG